jgi:hypothetical protein
LIFTNAMTYNSPLTIYFKEAQSLLEYSKKLTALERGREERTEGGEGSDAEEEGEAPKKKGRGRAPSKDKTPKVENKIIIKLEAPPATTPRQDQVARPAQVGAATPPPPARVFVPKPGGVKGYLALIF